jgi:hypothetical protein
MSLKLNSLGMGAAGKLREKHDYCALRCGRFPASARNSWMQTLAYAQTLYAILGRGFAILTWVSFYFRSACRAIQFVVQLVISA